MNFKFPHRINRIPTTINLLCFIFGFAFCFLSQHVLQIYSENASKMKLEKLLYFPLSSKNNQTKQYKDEIDIDQPKKPLFTPMQFDKNHTGHHEGEDFLSNYMQNKVRIFCFILTMQKNKESKAVHVKATWAKRFNGYIFISGVNDSSLPSLKAVAVEGRNKLWEKTRFAILHVFKEHINEYDFFMKADDDTYVIPENLRLLLHTLNPDEPIIMGRRFKLYVKQGYPSGGAGYVISRAGIKMMAEGILQNKGKCKLGTDAEDITVSACAEEVGVKMIDSLDEHGQECFHPFSPRTMIDAHAMLGIDWIHKYNYHNISFGLDCCSDHSVSFHYMSPNDMYTMEYSTYHLYPFGITRDIQSYNFSLRVKSDPSLALSIN